MPTHKYFAKRTVRDGINFASQLEADYYTRLTLLQKAGEIAFFLRQVPFHLPGNVTLRCDFMIVNKDGSIEFHETKGYMTAMAKMKLRQCEALYPVKIKIVKKV